MEEIKEQIEEIKAQIQEVKDKIFRLNLVDHWTQEDSSYSDMLSYQLEKGNKKLKELEEKLNENN